MHITIQIPSSSATFAEMERQFNALPLALRKFAYRQGNLNGAKAVVRIAKATGPRYTPREGSALSRKSARFRYVDNIVAEPLKRTSRGTKLSAARRSRAPAVAWAKAPHSNLVEWGRKTGTGKQRTAHHTMERAAEAAQDKILEAHTKAIRRILTRVARQMASGTLSRQVGRSFRDLKYER